MIWNQMNDVQRFNTLRIMSNYGGGFVGALSDAWRLADSVNSAILGEAFSDIILRYGPGSHFYMAQYPDKVTA
jgi:hypothetical protein